MKFNKRHPLLPEGSEYGMTFIAMLYLLLSKIRQTMIEHKLAVFKYLASAALMVSMLVIAFPVFARDAVASRIIDDANVLSNQQEKLLYSLLHDYEIETNQQFSIIITNNVGVEQSVTAYAQSVFSNWQFDQLEHGGLILVISPNRQAIHIQVGAQLQERISEARAKRIADGIIVPWLAHNRYMNGIEEGLGKLFELGKGEESVILPTKVPEQAAQEVPQYIELLLIAIALLGIGLQRLLGTNSLSRVVNENQTQANHGAGEW